MFELVQSSVRFDGLAFRHPVFDAAERAPVREMQSHPGELNGKGLPTSFALQISREVRHFRNSLARSSVLILCQPAN